MKAKENFIRKAKLAYSSLPGVRKWANRFASSPLYFKWLKKRIARQKEKDKSGPFNLVIETSNFCNARCLMCPHSIMKRSKTIMDNKTFSFIVKRIGQENLPVNKVFFSGMGEPLTDPNLLRRIEIMKKMGLPVRLYTNASLMTKEIARKIVALAIDEVNISFNGTNPIEYQKIMGIDFATTVDNINYLIEWKRRVGSKKPFIQISSILIKENKKNIKKHIQNWEGKVESVTVSLAHQWGGGVKVNPKLSIQNSSAKTYPCRSLWHTFVIDSQGNFVICCRDYESKHILGNIKTHTFADIKKNAVLHRFRQAHLKYSRDALPPMCQKCNFPYQDGVEWLLPRSVD